MNRESTTIPARAPDIGSALVVALLGCLLLSSLGLGLVLVSNTDVVVASNYRTGVEALYAADAAVEYAMSEALRVARWTDILTGLSRSDLFGTTLAPVLFSTDRVDLTAMTAQLQAASDAAMRLGPNNPQWQLFAHGLLARLPGGASLHSQAYVAVWIADDPSETDGNPWVDTNEAITAFARAMGPGRAQRAIEVVLARTSSASGVSGSNLRMLSWREIR